MDLSRSHEQDPLTFGAEASSLTLLLERGLHYVRQELYAEGITLLELARERLSRDQRHLSAALDALIQGHTTYWQAQQALHQASKAFAEAITEQQTRLATLEALLSAPSGDKDKLSQSHAAAQSLKNPQSHQAAQLRLSSSANYEACQPLQSSHLPAINPASNHSTRIPEPQSADDHILPALYITCFGHFEVRRSNMPVTLCSNRSGQTILRLLAVKQEHCATSDMLQTLLWPEDQPEAALNKLHIAISALRRSLNHGHNCEPGCGYIVCKNRTYYLNPAITVRTDVDDFLDYFQAGQQANEERVALYEKACRLYTGPFLTEDMYADWSCLQREELSRIYLTMCRVVADHYLKTKCYEDAAKWTTAILKENRCDEAAHRQLIQIYAARGHRSEALQQYQRCKLVLQEELGVQPLPETVLVFQALLADGSSSNQ